MLQISYTKMDPGDPIPIYWFIRGAVEVDPVAVYNNTIDLPLYQTGPEVTTIVAGVTPRHRITEVANFVTARKAQDELEFDSPFFISATVQMDARRGTPRALLFGHLEWSVRVVLPTPPLDHLPTELYDLVEQIGPCLGVGLEEKFQQFNDFLNHLTAWTLPLDAAPPMDHLLREIFPRQVSPTARERHCHGG
jgi:hypothetical protein